MSKQPVKLLSLMPCAYLLEAARNGQDRDRLYFMSIGVVNVLFMFLLHSLVYYGLKINWYTAHILINLMGGARSSCSIYIHVYKHFIIGYILLNVLYFHKICVMQLYFLCPCYSWFVNPRVMNQMGF